MSQSEPLNKFVKLFFLAGMILVILVLLIAYINDWDLHSYLIRYNRNAWLSELYICSGQNPDGELSVPKEIFLISEWQEIYVCGHIQAKEPIILDSIWFHNDEESPIASNPEIQVFDPGDFYISLYDTYRNTPNTDGDLPKLGKYLVIVTQGRMNMGEVFFEIIGDD